MPPPRIECWQNDDVRGICVMPRPSIPPDARNSCLSPSRTVTSAMGTSKISRALEMMERKTGLFSSESTASWSRGGGEAGLAVVAAVVVDAVETAEEESRRDEEAYDGVVR